MCFPCASVHTPLLLGMTTHADKVTGFPLCWFTQYCVPLDQLAAFDGVF